MDAISKGFILLPTFNRASTNVPRFFAAAKKTGMTVPGYIVVDEADYAKNQQAYDALDIPDNWTLHLVRGGCCAEATEQALRDLMEPDVAWVGWCGDDLVPETAGWDVKVVEALTGWNIASTDDAKDAPRKFNGFTAWSGDVVRAAGYLYPAGAKHYFIDTIWEDLAKQLGNWTCLMDVLVRHVHASSVGADLTTVKTNSFWKEDERAYMRWKNEEQLALANRIGQLMQDHKVAAALPSLAHVHVLIATPCGSGKYERLFMQSLWGTIETLRQCGAMVNFIELPYCSDIALARNKIFGTFLRSDATHLLSIDDDMGWRPADVIKMFVHDRDYVAVAGPRKVFPPSFAVQVVGENGQAVPLRQDGSGLIEVSHIGMAFTLIKRIVAVRVAAAHPELEYSGDDSRVEHAVFNPMIANRRYMSEDYAFCTRWRATGGKVYVDPSISLQHVGTFVWEGDWMSHLVEESRRQLRVA